VFKSAEDIVLYFVDFRLGYYAKRKAHLLAQLAEDLKILSNRAKFIKMIVDGELTISNRKRTDVEADLTSVGFDQVDGSYGYLTSMPIHSLTREKIDEINKSVDAKQKEIDKITRTTPADMYRTDLKDLRKKVV
jgi:DNA topoisomerase-2